MRLHRPLTPLVFVALAASQLGATDCGQITRDPGFDLWCGDALCTWKTERGEVKRVPTWHEGDAGVELVGDDVAIDQLTPVTSGDTTCIRFDLVANVSEDAEARLEVDVYGDGSVELSERIPTAHWKPLSYKIEIKAPYRGVRFQLTKRGPGRAVLAQISAESASGECTGFDVIEPGPAPLGADCRVDAACASGKCRTVADPGSWLGVAQVCVGCDATLGAAACGSGEVCGVGDPVLPVVRVPITCVPAAGGELGEQCLAGVECASGVCTSGVCSTCGGLHQCPVDEACNVAYDHGPAVCSPGGHRRTAGEDCVADADCASSQCAGSARTQCDDGRACTTPAQCPVDAGLEPGPCSAVGIQGGRCR